MIVNESDESTNRRINGTLNDLDEARDELIAATGGDEAYALVRSAVAAQLRSAEELADTDSVSQDEWKSLVDVLREHLETTPTLPADVIALACADYWSEEDLACHRAGEESPADFDLDESDEAVAERWNWLQSASERREAINAALVDRVLAWARDGLDADLVVRARPAMAHHAEGARAGGFGREARFDIAYLAQEAAWRVPDQGETVADAA